LHQQLEQRAQALPAGLSGIIHPELIPLPGEFPVLVNPIIPLPPQSFISAERPLRVNSANITGPFLNRPVAMTRAVRLPASQGYSVVLLNQEYLLGVMLPGLARRYFAGAAGWDYHLRIVSRDAPHQLIFAPDDPSLPTANGEADATGTLFSLRFELVENLGFGTIGFSTGRIGSIRQDEARTEIGVAFSASPAAPFPDGGATVVQHGVAGMEAGALWQFTLRHRSGSLEKAITQARQRNLLVSFGVLLLLAASMALVLILTARARRLAAQQLEFVAGISHELRTPVSAVCVASANLADGMIRGDEQVRQYGKMIQTEGRRLSEMIEQVLDLAGTEAVRRPYHLQPVPVAEPMQRALATLRQQSEGDGAKPLALECDLATGLPDLLADSRALERAFYNLLSNAAKYGGELGWIRITARAADAGQLAIAIADRGLGIEPAEMAQLFQPFWRGRAARAANLPGNGIGLCLVDRIVRAHGGRIIVNSAPGQGSTFTLYLPCVPPPAAEAG
jgi:signal transduction histidine kinase